MRHRNSLGAAGLAALVAGGLAANHWLAAKARPAVIHELRGPATNPAPPRVARTAEPGAVAETSALRREVSAMRAELSALHDEDRRAALAVAAERPERLSPEEQERRFRNQVTEIERVFQDEPRDHGWADDLADQIRAIAAEDGMPADLVRDVDCRSSTCKVELADADPLALERGIEKLVLKLAPTLPNATIGHGGDLKAPKANAVYFEKAKPGDDVPVVARE